MERKQAYKITRLLYMAVLVVVGGGRETVGVISTI